MIKTNVTQKELEVYKAVIEFCYDDAGAETKDIVKSTGFKINTVKGLIGSLTKKGLIDTYYDERVDRNNNYVDVDIIYPTFSENKWYMCDEFSEEEISGFIKALTVGA